MNQFQGTLLALLICVSVLTAQQTPPPAAPPSATPPAQLTPRQAAEIHADVLAARKLYPEAIAAYQELLAKEPSNAVLMNKIGVAYHLEDDLKNAERYYRRSVKADPKYADAINNYGALEYQKKNYGRAIRYYKKAIVLDPMRATFLSNLGYAYFAEEHFPEAIDTFRHAMQVDPNIFERSSSMGSVVQQRTTTQPGLFYFLLAKAYALSGDAERCAHYLELSRDEGNTDFHAVSSDPAFAAVLKDPRIQQFLESLQTAKSPRPGA